MIAALIDENLACDARGENYRYGTITKCCERQMREVAEHAEGCKGVLPPGLREKVDRMAEKYEQILAKAVNEGHRLMLVKDTRSKTYKSEAALNLRRYERLNAILEAMYAPDYPRIRAEERRP